MPGGALPVAPLPGKSAGEFTVCYYRYQIFNWTGNHLARSSRTAVPKTAFAYRLQTLPEKPHAGAAATPASQGPARFHRFWPAKVRRIAVTMQVQPVFQQAKNHILILARCPAGTFTQHVFASAGPSQGAFSNPLGRLENKKKVWG